MKIQTPGLIIKETNIGENDKLIVILTKEHGIIRAFADGARRIKSKNAAATSLLCYSNFTLYQNKDTYKVGDSSPIEMFFNLRYDLEGLALAQYFCDMAMKLTPEEFEPTEILRLVLNSLYFLTNKTKSLDIIKAVTELKLISLSGFMPNLTGCASCGEEKSYKFSFADGGLFCMECGNDIKDYTVVNPTVLSAMRHIIYSDFEKIYSFKIPEKDAKILSSITEKYVAIQSEQRFKTLDFYKSVKE